MENNKLIAKAVDYAKQNATRIGITAGDIALNAGFSIDYFNRIFQLHTGFTVMAYVNYIRLKKAAELLRTTDQSLLDIALEVGYDSHEGFLKAFKKKYDLTPSEYRSKMQNKVLFWGELIDKSIAAQFVYANPDFSLVDANDAIDFLLEKDAKRYGYFCATIKYMGLEIAAPDANLENGLIGIGDDRNGGYYLELLTDDFKLLADWIKRFPNAANFYSVYDPAATKDMIEKNGVTRDITATPQSFYFGTSIPSNLPAAVTVRPLSYTDKPYILQWSGGKSDGYINHLLNENHYKDPSVLEYGVFQNNELIAVAGCGIDEVHGFRLNNCCAIRFADGKAADELYRAIFSFVVNDLIQKEILPFDDLQHGNYAKTHGNFTSVDLGFDIVNWRYDLLRA